MSITLLRRNVILPHAKLNPNQKSFAYDSSFRGIDYIIKYIMQHKNANNSIGDKIFIIKSGTGSGKTSLIGPALLEAGMKRRIVITVPRRAIAEETPLEVATRNKNFKLGENIGFQTSINKKVPSRGVLYTTPGTLLQQLISQTPQYFSSRYGVIIIDEVHLHTIVSDFLLAKLKTLMEESFKNVHCPIIILMSATLHPKRYMEYFGTDHFLEVKGQESYPIKNVYATKDVRDLKSYIINIIKTIPVDDKDCLVFLPTIQLIKDYAKSISDRDTIELYSDVLGTTNVRRVFLEKGNGRIILASNAVQEGVNFPYVGTVIDSGLMNSVSFNPIYEATIVCVKDISYYDAVQRRGRTGRFFDGVWFPCYTVDTFNELEKAVYPDIYKTEFTIELLQYLCDVLKCNIDTDGNYSHRSTTIDLLNIPLIYKPSSEMLQYCLEKLYILGFVSIPNWIPTHIGYATSLLMSKFTIESKKSIISSGIYSKYMIMLGCCLSSKFGRQPLLNDILTPLGITPMTYKDNFIEIIGLFQIIQFYINNVSGIHLPEIKQWFIKNKLDIEIWMYIIELYHETIISLISNGFDIRNSLNDFVWTLDDAALLDIKKILYDSYRMNVVHKENGKYYLHYKHIEFKYVKHPFLTNDINWFVIDDVIYKSNPFTGVMNFTITPATKISIIDDIDTKDPYFIYGHIL